MLIMATFNYTLELEQALLILEREGIDRRGIMIVPMDSQGGNMGIAREPDSDWQQNSVGTGVAVGTAFAVIGICRGFILEWGPLIWGLISAGSGFAVGFGLYALLHFKVWKRGVAVRGPEAAVIVRVGEENERLVRQVLWRHRALSIGRIANPDSSEEKAWGTATSV